MSRSSAELALYPSGGPEAKPLVLSEIREPFRSLQETLDRIRTECRAGQGWPERHVPWESYVTDPNEPFYVQIDEHNWGDEVRISLVRARAGYRNFLEYRCVHGWSYRSQPASIKATYHHSNMGGGTSKVEFTPTAKNFEAMVEYIEELERSGSFRLARAN